MRKTLKISKTLVLQNGMIVDPLRRDVFAGDLKIAGGTIEEVGSAIAGGAGAVALDVAGKLVMPGLVDMHVHVAAHPEAGCNMLVRAGVTTALDMAGTPEAMLNGIASHGTGLTIAFMYPLIPGETVSGDDPSRAEIAKVIDFALGHGALGLKILGGHYPLRRAATAMIIELAAQKHCRVAVHAGTVETPGTIRGLEELVELAGGYPVHIAHVNSYCRGAECGDPLAEAQRALAALRRAPQCCSESYLASINGTSGKLDENGMPRSAVTKRCLIQGGFTADMDGVKQAILKGWAKVHFFDATRREIVFPAPAPALEYYLREQTAVRLSFAVNSPLAAIPLALAREPDGAFTVDALATDGGEIPRNVTLRQGLGLVNIGALSLNELALKAALTPARLLGLPGKGLLTPGADADVIVVDPVTAAAELVVSNGEIIMDHGQVCGAGGIFITRPAGAQYFAGHAVRCAVNAEMPAVAGK